VNDGKWAMANGKSRWFECARMGRAFPTKCFDEIISEIGFCVSNSYFDCQAIRDVMLLSRKIRLLILLLVLGCAAGCDQASKHLARTGLDHLGSVTLPGGFGELRLADNPGSFLGLGDRFPEPIRLALFTGGVGVGLVGLFAYLISARLGRCSFVGLALIWAGGMSNFLDRVTRQGLVTDFVFIRVGPFHTGVFNAADVMVMVGMAVLVIDIWRRRRVGASEPRATAPD
jgi:signal peptidase II